MLRGGRLIACGTYEQVAALQLQELIGGAVTMSLDVDPQQQQEKEKQEQEQLSAAATAVTTDAAASDPTAAAAAAACGNLPPSTQQQQQQEGVAGATNASSSNNSSSEVDESSDPDFGRVLSRIRTMAPDVNRRPADSGCIPQNSSSGSMLGAAGGAGANNNGGGWWAARGASFARVASRVRSMGSGFFSQPSQQQRGGGDGDDAGDEWAVEDDSSSRQQQRSSAWARVKLWAYCSIAGLFTPPAYLPGGAYYPSTPPHNNGSSSKAVELQSGGDAATAWAGAGAAPDGFGRAPSRKGLLLLGPVRSFIQQPSMHFRSGSSKWLAGAAAHPAAGKAPLSNGNGTATVAAKGVSNGAAATGAAAAAPVGQLVAAEGREIGSVSWTVYGQYCRQMGLLSAAAIMLALFAGQGLAIAAEWWLALWASAPKAEQSQLQ